jgi:hypothetical protein
VERDRCFQPDAHCEIPIDRLACAEITPHSSNQCESHSATARVATGAVVEKQAVKPSGVSAQGTLITWRLEVTEQKCQPLKELAAANSICLNWTWVAFGAPLKTLFTKFSANYTRNPVMMACSARHYMGVCMSYAYWRLGVLSHECLVYPAAEAEGETFRSAT